jgi:hypothetical protein
VKAKLNLDDMGRERNEAAGGIQTSNRAQEQISSTPADWPRHMISWSGTHTCRLVCEQGQTNVFPSPDFERSPHSTGKMFKARRLLATIFFRVARF